MKSGKRQMIFALHQQTKSRSVSKTTPVNGWSCFSMYGKEYEGVIRSTVVIDPKGILRLAWPKAKAKGHASEVLTELKKLSE